MLSTIGLVAGLSTGHKIGLAAVGATFIVFALVSSFLLPLRNPNFPGRRLGWYVTVSVLFFVAMISAVLIFGKEKKEASAEPSTSTSAAATTTAPSAAPSAADLAAGKAVFQSQGCASCHTFKAAAATAKIGPDLDKLKQYATQANRGPLTAFIKESIVDPNAYIAPGYPRGVMPPTFGTSIPPDKLTKLVAFLAAGTT